MKINPHIHEDPDTFIRNNMKLANSVALKFYHKLYKQGLEKDDILSIGYIGLIKAYEKFNPTKFKGENDNEIKFSTYAVPMIWGEISNNIRANYDFISIPNSVKETVAKIRKAGYLEEDNPKEISHKLNIPLKLIKSGMQVLNQCSLIDSLDRGLDENESSNILADLIQGDTGKELENEIILNDFLSLLSNQMLEVYKLRFKYGFNQREVGELLDLSQKIVSRIEKKIFDLAEMYCGDVAC